MKTKDYYIGYITGLCYIYKTRPDKEDWIHERIVELVDEVCDQEEKILVDIEVSEVK